MISRSMSCRFLILAALAALASIASAQTPPWTPLGPFGGAVDSITTDPVDPGVLYAATGSGLYRTADAGASWTLVYAGTLFSSRVAVDPLHPSILYLTGVFDAATVLKSIDSGAHWSPAGDGLPPYYPTLAVDPARPRRLYLGSVGFWRSVDAGASWQPAGVDTLPDGDHANILAIAPASRPAGKVLVATSRGVYRSTDGGATWSGVGGLPQRFAFAVAFAPSDPRIVYAALDGSGLYRSTDGGVSWRLVLKLKPTSIPREIAISASPRTVYVRLETGALYRSTDGGDHWTQLKALATAVTADPFAAATVWSSLLTGPGFGGVWRSADQGKAWTERNHGMTGFWTTSLAIDREDPDRLGTTAAPGPLRTNNGGGRWVGMRIPRGETGLLRMAAGPGSRIVALSYNFPPGEEPPPATYKLWQTDDDGASWKRLAAPADRILTFRIASPSTLYAVEARSPAPSAVQRLLRSTDGGLHWENRAQTALGCGLGDLAAAPSQVTIVYLGGCKAGHAAVLRSGDGGATFSDLPAANGLPGSSIPALAVDPRSPNTVWAGTGSDGVWKSVEGGAWARAGNELAGLTITALLAPDVPGRVYAAALDGRIFRSGDGGASWEDRSAGLRVTGISGLAADPDDPRRIYAVTAQGIWTLTETD